MAMNTKDFCARAEAALGGRGWMARLSESTGIHYSTVKRWAAGDLPPPEWTHALIELLEITPAAMRPSRFVKPPRARSGA